MCFSATSWSLAILLLFAPYAALAAEETHGYPDCPGPVADAAVAAAKAAFQAGQASFNEADYTRAIVYWEDALRRDCNANPLLLNLARAYELNGKKEQAVVSLETYLARVPDDPQAGSIRRRVTVLTEQIEQSNREQQKKPVPAPAKTPTRTEPRAAEQVEPAVEEPSESERPLWPLFVAGGGGIVAATGFVLAAVAHGDVADAEKSCTENPIDGTFDCSDNDAVSKGNDARARRSIGLGVGIGGAVIAGAGVAWYFLQPVPGATTAGIELGRGGPWLDAGVSPTLSRIELRGVF